MSAPLPPPTDAFAAFRAAVGAFQRDPTETTKQNLLEALRKHLEAADVPADLIASDVKREDRRCDHFIEEHGTRTNGRDWGAAG